jgi:aryl-alcohol dehydrogenase-like predicted oxidoreductase
MDYVNLGKSGLKVSRLCLGGMSYGVPERGPHPWTLKEDESRPFLQRALKLGINFFDTANVYSDGTSEEIVGRALRDFAKRDEIVLATAALHLAGIGIGRVSMRTAKRRASLRFAGAAITAIGLLLLITI